MYGQPSQMPPYPGPKRNHTLLIVLLSIFGGAMLIGVLIFVGLVAFVNNANKTDSTYTGSDETNPSSSTDTSALSYKYGETATERIIGVDVSGIRTEMGYVLLQNGNTAYASDDSSCNIIVNHGFAPDEWVNTGNDETATEGLLNEYLRKLDHSPLENRDFVYVDEDGSQGIAPTKYSEAMIDYDGNGEQYSGTYARVISGAPKIVVTITVLCKTDSELQQATEQVEQVVKFWPTEAKY